MFLERFDLLILAGVTPKSVKVYLNDKKIQNIESFKSYVEMYMKASDKDNGVEMPFFYEIPDKRWEVAVSSSDGQFQQVSYVNSICTVRGGTHVDFITDQIDAKILEAVKKKNKDLKNIKSPKIKVRFQMPYI